MSYTYLLHHKPTNTFYYGVRWAKGCNPSEFWKTYFTSSRKMVPLLRTLFGDYSFEFEIRKVFDSKEKAIVWEEKVLRRVKVLDKTYIWLNRNDGKAILNLVSPTLGRVVSEEQKEIQRIKMLGKPATSGSFKKGRIPLNKGKSVSEEERKRLKEICKNRIPWNKGRQGLQRAWNKGLTKTDSRVLKNITNMCKTRYGNSVGSL